MDLLYKYFWLIRMIIRNFDGTKTHYPTEQFIREEKVSKNDLFLKILDWQTDNKFKE